MTTFLKYDKFFEKGFSTGTYKNPFIIKKVFVIENLFIIDNFLFKKPFTIFELCLPSYQKYR